MLNKFKAFLTLVILLLIFPTAILFAQNNLLNKSIDIELKNVSLFKALSVIEVEAGCRFSYAQGVINVDSLVSIDVVQMSVRQIIEKLCGPNITPLESGNHIVLKKSEKKATGFTGCVINAKTGSRVVNAKISTPAQNRARTNRQGNFSVRCSEYPCFITVSAYGYRDTVIYVPGTEKQIIALEPGHWNQEVIIKAPVIAPGQVADDTTKAESIAYAFEIRPLNDSIGYTELESKNFQFSLLPFIGTNFWYSGKYRYATSVNLIGGYVGSVSGAEIGLIINIVRRNVIGFQFAGIINLVNGSVSGTQVSPGINIVFNSMTGVQAAGVFNYCRNDLYGMQFALIHNNLVGNGNGIQLSLISNLSAGSLNGMQISGISSLSKGEYVGSQIASIVNIADSINGNLQLSALYNDAYEAHGFQVSAFGNRDRAGNPLVQSAFVFNIADCSEILQFPALFNQCRQNKGLQLGLINVSDTCKGAQIGFINVSNSNTGFAAGFFTVIKDGYRAVELSYSELNQINLCFKSGLPHFYNIIYTGFSTDFGNMRLNLGYGLGSSFALNHRWLVNCDITASHVFEKNNFVKDLNLWIALKPQIGVNIARKFILFAGTSINLSLSNWKNPYTEEFLTELSPDYAYFSRSNGQTKATLWQGFNIGIRF